jgi:MoaA/NifB/PqqE/SkfB family radical SAM enzyme
MFEPVELIFAPTSRCNLACAHCRVGRGPEELDTASAVAFMERVVAESRAGAGAAGGGAAGAAIELVGFSGGEPFLRPDFLVGVSRAAVALDLQFDRLMTNGVWWRDRASLDGILGELHEAGFDGTIGLSVDGYHGQDPARLATFVEAVFAAAGRKDCVEILSVAAPGDESAHHGDLARLEALAAALGGELLLEEGEPDAIVDARELARDDSGEDEPEALYIDVIRFPCSAAGAPEAAGSSAAGPLSPAAGPWSDAAWFEDDWCAGPGNVLYVHPDGRVASCCGFANENPELILGNIAGDGLADLMRRAAESPQLRRCYVTGLATHRAALEAAGRSFPGKTLDMCFFCDWLCKHPG